MKLVNESLDEWFVEDPQVDGEPDEIEEVEETEFTPEQKASIEEFIKDYEGEFEDEDIHALADELGLEHGEVEEYIYGMARDGEETPEEKPKTEPSTKEGHHVNIEEETLNNEDFRRVLYTGENLQLVLMSLKPGEEIGMETHDTIDQFFRFEAGTGTCIINQAEYEVADGDSIIIPAGSEHNIINTGDDELKMYTIYSPPNHQDGVVFATKEEAEGSDEQFDGQTTE